MKLKQVQEGRANIFVAEGRQSKKDVVFYNSQMIREIQIIVAAKKNFLLTIYFYLWPATAFDRQQPAF